MIVTFCGHSSFCRTEKLERELISLLEERVGNEQAEMYLGEYGAFDSFAYDCCKKYKKTHPNISLVFVTPYMTLEYQKKHLKYQKMRFDSIIYPEIEDKPLKFAISYRNKYMVEKADLVIAFVSGSYGGAYATYKHAKKCEKEIINLSGM